MEDSWQTNKKCAVTIGNEGKIEPVEFTWKWITEGRPVPCHSSALGVELLKDVHGMGPCEEASRGRERPGSKIAFDT